MLRQKRNLVPGTPPFVMHAWDSDPSLDFKVFHGNGNLKACLRFFACGVFLRDLWSDYRPTVTFTYISSSGPPCLAGCWLDPQVL